jgi:hypothetical protein
MKLDSVEHQCILVRPGARRPPRRPFGANEETFLGMRPTFFSFGYGALPYPAIRFVHDRRSVLCGEAARPGRVLFQSADKVVALQGIERGQPMPPRARQPDRGVNSEDFRVIQRNEIFPRQIF